MADKDKIWSDVKKGIKDTVTYVSEKTEELTTLGRLKLDIAGINRKVDKKFNELGKNVYSKMDKEEGLVLDSDEEIKTIIEEVSALEEEKAQKEKELEELKKKEEKEEVIAEAEEVKDEAAEETTEEKEEKKEGE
jgi:hypothetical protein